MFNFLSRRFNENKNKRGQAHLSNGCDIAKNLSIGKSRDSSQTFIFQRPRGKNKGGIKEKISPTFSASVFEHNNLLISDLKQVGNIDKKGHNSIWGRVYSPEGTRDRDKKGKAILTSIPKRRIRRLTPRECERLQGFPNDFTAIGDKGKISDTQRYKMMGNAISCPVVEAIGGKILERVA